MVTVHMKGRHHERNLGKRNYNANRGVVCAWHCVLRVAALQLPLRKRTRSSCTIGPTI